MIEFCEKNFNDFVNFLYEKQDLKYKEFNDKIVNGAGESIGIRIPELRRIAKEISKSEHSLSMLEILDKQNLFEMRMIQAVLIGIIKNDNQNQYATKNLAKNFVENRINNWALCDCFVSSLRKKINQDKECFYEMAKYYAQSENTWEIRFGLVMFLSYFREKIYFEEINNIILNIKSQAYYVKMGAAWLISMLYVEMKSETLMLLKNENLDKWIRNKAIQKIKESYRVSVEEKQEVENIRKELVLKK